jgi:superfamily II RNA helicase
MMDSPFNPDDSTLLGRFLDLVAGRGIELYPAQENAILEVFAGNNVVLKTPTGSGKSLVAEALHFMSLSQGKRSVYTCPIKALVNEKFMALCHLFGPENIGLATGDASVNRGAPILCCTAEILSNLALRDGSKAGIQDVTMDEFHYYGDRDRGAAWQIPLLTMPQTRFLLMSATMGDSTFFESELTRLNGRPTIAISSADRPVPLEFSYSEIPLAQTVESLLSSAKGPIYVVHFSQGEAAQSAQDFTSINVCTREEKNAIADAIAGFQFNSPYGPDVKKWLRHGIGLHHAGLLPKYRVLVEQLAQRGLLKVICGTDTLGLGINVPIRTVLFTRLCKYSGEKTAILTARDFHQIAGRAGRKGFDDLGWVVAQAPEYVVENLRLEQSGKKFVKRKPPEKHFANWDNNTFTRLISAPPERLASRFQVTHGMLLNVLSRNEDGCRAMRNLINDCHDSAKEKKVHRRRAFQLFRALIERKIIEFIPKTPEGAKVRVNAELQDDFSLNQTLAIFVHDTIPLLDPQSPEYPLLILTLAESILEDPDFILRKQLDRVKTDAMVEMKAQGLDYNERMEELEKLEYPKPNREFIYPTFNAFAARHPWVGTENIRLKSIAREMFEDYRSFADYVKLYDLQRAEGILLRHLSGVYKVLQQTVPDSAKDDGVLEIEHYFALMLRQVDSSLIQEWEKMRDPNYRPPAESDTSPKPEAAPDITRNLPAFKAAIRARIFTFLRAAASGDVEGALSVFPEKDGNPGADSIKASLTSYQAGHQRIRLDPEARNLRHLHVTPSEDNLAWNVQQTIVDPEELNDWVVEFQVALSASREAGTPVMCMLGIHPLS